ncbi:hypothetical protein GCM10020331_099820 [Ectobacillus funiculus]
MQTIAYFGIIFILNKYIDEIATALDWYDYRIQVQPGIIPSMLVANLFHYSNGIKYHLSAIFKMETFLIALGLFFDFFTSYIALFFSQNSGHLFRKKAWNAHWSCISLVVMGVIAKIVIDRVVLIQAHNNGDQSNSDPSSPIT